VAQILVIEMIGCPNQTYDGANRVTQVTSTASDAQHPASFFTADSVYGFFPHGALRKAALGNGLTQSNVYDNRLQPCLIDVANNSSLLLQACSDGTPTGNVLDFWMGYNNGLSDNGNVMNWNATGTQTVELKINFFRPVWETRLRAEGKVLRRGSTIGYIECEITDESGRLVAKASSTCMALRGERARGR
jgi:hypothetical protein